MNAKWPPRPQTVLDDLAELQPLLHQALLEGVDDAVKYHEDRQRVSIDPWVYALLARDSVKAYLGNADLGSLGFEVVDLAMQGLYLRGKAYELRVLKGRRIRDADDEVRTAIPAPGSNRRLDYFHQPLLSGFPDAEGHLGPVKLVALWDHDAHHQLGAFDLACPSRFSKRSGLVETHWLVPFDPATDLSILGAGDAEFEMLDDFDALEQGRLPAASGDSSG